jgi:hypothetical protein
MSDLPACHDCAAKPGEPHSDGCDTARCLVSGIQRLQCDEPHDCGHDVWTGEWPGTTECREFGWYSRWADDAGQPIDYATGGLERIQAGHWEQCGPGDPGAGPDLNRLHGHETRWDRERQRWVLEPWAAR